MSVQRRPSVNVRLLPATVSHRFSKTESPLLSITCRFDPASISQDVCYAPGRRTRPPRAFRLEFPHACSSAVRQIFLARKRRSFGGAGLPEAVNALRRHPVGMASTGDFGTGFKTPLRGMPRGGFQRAGIRKRSKYGTANQRPRPFARSRSNLLAAGSARRSAHSAWRAP